MRRTWTLPLLILVILLPLEVEAQRRGRGRGLGFRRGQDERHQADQKVFHFLLENHKKIDREVTEIPNGVMTLTESKDPQVASHIKEHVKWMLFRIENTKPIRRRDPLFNEIFQHTDKIEVEREETPDGVRIIETSKDPYVVKLIQAHAKTVSAFVKDGFREAMKNHAVPGRSSKDEVQYHNPKIEKYGKVVALPKATQQPQSGSKIVVDVTKGGDPAELNSAIEKVARYVNIYAGAGKAPADVNIAIVLHGDATLTILNADAYQKRFSTKANPNLDCLHALHEAGVEIFVCGQSLLGKGAHSKDVVVFADVAVSALTALVNLQTEGFAYIPLTK